jgi:hypothetical protein
VNVLEMDFDGILRIIMVGEFGLGDKFWDSGVFK